MKYVPRGDRSQWHTKVLKVTGGADLSNAIGLYMELKEWDRLAQLVRKAKAAALEDLSHYTTEPAAKKLTKSHPDAAAKLFQAMTLRILNAKKSKYYAAALGNLDRARKCLEKAGLGKKWDALVAKIRSEPSRKTSLTKNEMTPATTSRCGKTSSIVPVRSVCSTSTCETFSSGISSTRTKLRRTVSDTSSPRSTRPVRTWRFTN